MQTTFVRPICHADIWHRYGERQTGRATLQQFSPPCCSGYSRGVTLATDDANGHASIRGNCPVTVQQTVYRPPVGLRISLPWCQCQETIAVATIAKQMINEVDNTYGVTANVNHLCEFGPLTRAETCCSKPIKGRLKTMKEIWRRVDKWSQLLNVLF